VLGQFYFCSCGREHPQNYALVMRQADTGNAGPLTEVVARAVSGAMSKFLISKLAGEAKLVPLAALATTSGYSADYMRQLAQAGKLRALRERRLWLSSKAWLDEYIAARDPRGGIPGTRRRADF
jgi:hypothetical protein